MAKKTGWKGIGFPFKFNNGRVVTSEAIIDENSFEKINQSIQQIIGTFMSERKISNHVGLPNRMAFKNFNEELIPYYESLVTEAIARSERRIVVEIVELDPSDISNGVLIVRVYWSFVSSNVPNLSEAYIEVDGGE